MVQVERMLLATGVVGLVALAVGGRQVRGQGTLAVMVDLAAAADFPLQAAVVVVMADSVLAAGVGLTLLLAAVAALAAGVVHVPYLQVRHQGVQAL